MHWYKFFRRCLSAIYAWGIFNWHLHREWLCKPSIFALQDKGRNTFARLSWWLLFIIHNFHLFVIQNMAWAPRWTRIPLQLWASQEAGAKMSQRSHHAWQELVACQLHGASQRALQHHQQQTSRLISTMTSSTLTFKIGWMKWPRNKILDLRILWISVCTFICSVCCAINIHNK